MTGMRHWPTTHLIWHKLKLGPKLLGWQCHKPQSPSCRYVWRLVYDVLRSNYALRHSRITRWRLHKLARIALFLSWHNSRQLARPAFGGQSPPITVRGSSIRSWIPALGTKRWRLVICRSLRSLENNQQSAITNHFEFSCHGLLAW